MADALSEQDKFYEWANEVFAGSPFDPRTGNLMGLVASLVTGYQGAVSYFYHAAKVAGATEADLTSAADIAAATSGLNIYALMPKDE